MLPILLAITIALVPFTQAQIECSEKCIKHFSTIVLSGVQPEIHLLCETFKNFESCMDECPNGHKLMDTIADMVPSSFKLLVQTCSQDLDGVTVTPSPALVAKVAGEYDQFKGGDTCAQQCENGFDLSALSPGEPVDLARVCAKWADFEECLLGCPGGAIGLKSVKENFPSIFNTIESYCGPSPQVDVVTLDSSDDDDDDDIKDTTAVDIFAPPPPRFPLSSSSGSLEEPCKLQCFSIMDSFSMDASMDDMCALYAEFTECLDECGGGDEIMAQLRTMMPKTLDIIQDLCSGDPERKDAALARIASPGLIGTVEGEGEEAEAMADCVERCELHIQQMTSQMAILGLEGVCNKWSDYKGCITRCPGGDAVFDMVADMMPGMLSYIEDACEPFDGGLASGSTELIDGPMEPPFPSALSTTDKMVDSDEGLPEGIDILEPTNVKVGDQKFMLNGDNQLVEVDAKNDGDDDDVMFHDDLNDVERMRLESKRMFDSPPVAGVGQISGSKILAVLAGFGAALVALL